jgi:hypothetical protein
MKAYLMITAACALLIACSDSVTTSGSVLKGDWGTTNVRVVATADTVTLTTACMAAAFPGPVPVDSNGQFSAVGVVTFSQLAHPEIQHVHLSGVTSGANILVGFYTGDPTTVPPVVTYTLTPGGYVGTIGCD